MADNVIDRSGGFGNTYQKDDNSEQIRELLDQVQELMIEDGADPATAEALTNYARPAQVTLSGNLADLNRMGQIANQGKIDTPPGEADIPATNLEEAFTTIVPPAPDLNQGLQTPMGQIDGEGNAVESTSDSRTKAEIQAELDERGIEWNSGDTKADLLDKLNG